jgi:flagellar protein FlaI
MFDLLKASLRQRPDFIIVGEVRGEEAFTLLQSIATGHGGFGTIHADSVEATINRLTTEPMNIPRSLVGTTLDCIVMQLKLRLSDRSVRRVVAVTEVVGHDRRTDEIILNDAFTWDPVGDRFVYTGRSKLFDKITQKYGTRPEEIRREIDGRKLFLDWLVAKDVRGHIEVSKQVREFYAGPYSVINKAKVELEGLKA